MVDSTPLMPDPNAQSDPNAQAGPSVPQGADDQDPRAVGTPEQNQNELLSKDSAAPVQASPKEQAQYDSLVSRFMLMISDPRKQKGGTSPAQAVLDTLNNASVPLPITLGQVTAQILAILFDSAKAQGAHYEPDVVLHAGITCVEIMYVTGKAAGIFKGVPPFKDLQSAFDFTKQEADILVNATMHAAEVFGKHLLKTGQLSADDSKDYKDFWKHQIQNEVESGSIPDSVMHKLMGTPLMGRIEDHLNGQNQTADQPAPPLQQPQPPAPQQPEPGAPPSAQVPQPQLTPQGGQ